MCVPHRIYTISVFFLLFFYMHGLRAPRTLILREILLSGIP